MIKTIRFRVLYVKNLYIPVLCIFFIFCLILFPKSSVSAASKGINLWLNVVFPSLFPFFVGADLLNKSGIIRAFGILFEPIMRPLFNVPGCGSFAFVMGITSGYPIGAKLTASMREVNMLSKVEAERLLAFTNNSGPLFIIGAVAVGMFNKPELGLFFLICHILACISVGILFRFYERGHRKLNKKPQEKVFRRFYKEFLKTNPNTDFGTMFGNAIKDSLITSFAIGGFIIFFSVIISLLTEIGFVNGISGILSVVLEPLEIGKDIISSIISGFFEITTGVNIASKAVTAPYAQRLIAAALIIGWAGISVHAQVLSIVSKTDISIKPYLAGKLLQGIIAAVYTYIAVNFLGINFISDAPTFIPQHNIYTYTISNLSFAEALEHLPFSFTFLIVCTVIVLIFRFSPGKSKYGN